MVLSSAVVKMQTWEPVINWCRKYALRNTRLEVHNVAKNCIFRSAVEYKGSSSSENIPKLNVVLAPGIRWASK